MFPRFHRLLPPALPQAPAAGGGTPPAAVGNGISRVPRFAAAVVGRPARSEAAPGDTHDALCETLTQLVDTLAAEQGKDALPPTAHRVRTRGDGPAPARTPRYQALPRTIITRPEAVAGLGGATPG